jgi:hypothetical protein
LDRNDDEALRDELRREANRLGEMGWCMGAAIGAFLGFLVVGALTNALLAIVGLPWAR